MTVAAVEAAPVVESAAPAAADTATAGTAARSAARRPRTARASASRAPARGGTVTYRDRSTDRRQRAAQGQKRRKGESYTPRELGEETKRRAPTTPSSGTNYQPAILAEFVAAIILVSVTPFATSKNPEGLSPYAGSDIVKLLALTMVYLILALISSTGRSASKFAALFGLLVLLTVGLNEAANLVAAFDLLAGIVPGSGSGDQGGLGAGGGGGGGGGKK